MSAAAAPPQSDHRKGLTLTFIGGLLLTFDVPLIRLVQSDPWTILFCRGMMVFAVTGTYWLVFHRLRGSPLPFVNGMEGVAAAVLQALASLCFYSAIFHTTAANLVFIVALNPMFSAILSWLVLKERVGPATWTAIVFSLGGVLIIVYDGLGQGTLLGDGLALVTAFLLACSLAVMRKSGKDMSLMPAHAAMLAGAFATFLSQPWTLGPVQWTWLTLNAAAVMPLAGALLALGTRFVSAPEVAMFFLLETAITPVWVWMIFSEVPSRGSLAGGTVVLVTLFAHSLYRLVQGQRARRVAFVQAVETREQERRGPGPGRRG